MLIATQSNKQSFVPIIAPARFPLTDKISNVAMALVLGIGVGLFVLILLWVVGILGCVALSRTSGGIRNAMFGIAIALAAVTVIMFVWPRKTIEEELDGSVAKKVVVDELAIPRIVIFVFTCLFALLAFVFLLLFHWMEPIYSPALTSRKTYQF